MEIEKIASKLRPLIPEKIDHWMRIRETADPELRTLVEKQILIQAQKILGDYRNKILLSLPGERKVRGELKLGKVIYNGEKWEAGLSRKELMQHLAIFGRSGAGKSNAVFHLLLQLDQAKIPFLFLDWKRTARHLLPGLKNKVQVFTPGRTLSRFHFNPFQVPAGMEKAVYINMLIDVMADAFTLGDGSKRILQQALWKCYESGKDSPTPDEIIQEVEKLPDKERQRSWKISTLRALESIKFSGMDFSDSGSRGLSINALVEKSSIFELDALDESLKRFIVPLLALRVYQSKLNSSRRENLDLVIIVEEAHHVFYRHEHRSKESLMNRLLRQCREIGIGMVIVDQHPHLISAAALGNTFTTICMNLKDPADINRAAGLSLLDSEDKRYLSMLPVGYGIVKMQDRWRDPFLVRFPLVDVKKGSVSDQDLELYLRSMADSGPRGLGMADSERVQRVLLSDSALTEDGWRFLEDVVNHPLDGVKARYVRLGLSVDRGTRLKGGLIDKGWLESSTVAVGKHSRKIVLRLSRWAVTTLGLDDWEGRSRPWRESLNHEYWKRWWAEKYRRRGYKVVLEAPRRGGRVDVLAITPDGSEKIGIEVETGKSDVVGNIQNGLLSGFTKILVVVTDRGVLPRVERDLGRAGLLGGGRVEVVVGNSGEEIS